MLPFCFFRPSTPPIRYFDKRDRHQILHFARYLLNPKSRKLGSYHSERQGCFCVDAFHILGDGRSRLRRGIVVFLSFLGNMGSPTARPTKTRIRLNSLILVFTRRSLSYSARLVNVGRAFTDGFQMNTSPTFLAVILPGHKYLSEVPSRLGVLQYMKLVRLNV